MKSILQQSRLHYLIRQRNGYLMLASGLLLLCLTLALLCFYLSQRERVILVPPIIEKSFWVSHSNISPEYLAEMSLFFCYLRLNVTSANIDNQRQILLRYTDPRYFGALNNLLVQERDHIIEQHLSTAFYPVNVEVNAKTLTVNVIGDLITHVGESQVSQERVTYRLQYRYDQARLLVNQFQEVVANASLH